MTKFLMTYFSDYGGTTYDAISSELIKNGNDVFRYNINSKETSFDKWGGNSFCKDNNLINEIKKFRPDIVLNFNNSLPQNIELFNMSKICLIDADAPLVFWNKDYLKRNKNKYYYIGLQRCSKNMYKNFFNITLDSKNYIYMPMATSTQKQNIIQDKKISFIGSNFYPLTIPDGEDFYSAEALELYEAFTKNYFLPINEAEKICKTCQNIQWLYEKVRAYYVGQERLKYLQQLTDLGLTLYGVRWWSKIAYYDFELARCFNPTPILCLEDTTRVYNSSKISINISHPQAQTSFSWRVMDIMASNSCLLMENKPDWRELFEKHLSKETLNSIIYKDRFDMREKAKRLLNNEELRKKCVGELNLAIEKNGRWKHRFKLLEIFLKHKILNISGKDGIYIYVQNDNIVKNQTHYQQRKKKNKRWKLLYYLLILLALKITFADIFVKQKYLEKIQKKIIKYGER